MVRERIFCLSPSLVTSIICFKGEGEMKVRKVKAPKLTVKKVLGKPKIGNFKNVRF